MIGTALTRPSLTMQLTSGMDVFMHVHVQKMDTLCNYCDNVQPHDETFQFMSILIIFMLFFGNYHKFKLLSQHTEGTYGGKYYTGFVENLILFPAVREF